MLLGRSTTSCVIISPAVVGGIAHTPDLTDCREREALDQLNTAPRSESNKEIVSEELGQDTFKILRNASLRLANVMYGCSADEGEREQTGWSIRGALYFTSLWGNDEEGSVLVRVCPLGLPVLNDPRHFFVFWHIVAVTSLERSTRERDCTPPTV